MFAVKLTSINFHKNADVSLAFIWDNRKNDASQNKAKNPEQNFIFYISFHIKYQISRAKVFEVQQRAKIVKSVLFFAIYPFAVLLTTIYPKI